MAGATAVTERASAGPLRVVRTGGDPRSSAVGTGRTRAGKSGPDRLTVILLSLTMFLGLVAVLADQLRAPSTQQPRVVLIRRIYVTRIVRTVPGRGSGTAVSQSVATSGSASPAAVTPTTRPSGSGG